MTNYQALQSFENMFNLPLVPKNIDSPIINFNVPKSLHLQFIAPSNYDFKNLSQDFIDKYCLASALGIDFMSYYYQDNCCISLHFFLNTEKLFEFNNYLMFKNKLSELAIILIKFCNLFFTSQPVSKNKILISAHGNIYINNLKYSVITTFLILIKDSVPKIINHIIKISS